MDANLSDAGWKLENSYHDLPELFFTPWKLDPVREPGLAVFNRKLAEDLGLNSHAFEGPEAAALFAGNVLPPGSRPLAQAYAGHQFGHFTGLGDGRALLLGEQITPDGRRMDIQLKGSGRTPYSRNGDGRAALGPMLREYIISEAMHALGIPTTRSLAVATTGEEILRQDGFLPGAVLTRVAASHIRVGTFQWAAAHQDASALKILVAYTLQRHYPDTATSGNPALTLLENVVARQARLIAQWMNVGFIHGVMNTDNMAVSGETIDYGPCAFMDHYDPATVFSSIDRHGRYAYGNQPAIAAWNLSRFAEALLPVLDESEDKAVELANSALQKFPGLYARWHLDGLRSKLGLFDEHTEDESLIKDLLDWMARTKTDFTGFFRSLATREALESPVNDDPDHAEWFARWRLRRESEGRSMEEVVEIMQSSNPAVIPRNHKVEEALQAAGGGDFGPFHRLLEVLSKPFDSSAPAEFLEPAPAGATPYCTFCGT